MKKSVIGYIYSKKDYCNDERIFIDLAKKKKIELVMIDITDDYEIVDIRKKIENCDIIYNNSGEEFAVEIIKTIESYGKRVIDSSETSYYLDDKWMTYLKCKAFDIPTLKTILLSQDMNIARKELLEYNEWPVVLKRVLGTMGEFVDKADNADEALKIIKKFWEKGNERLPIIAQEFVKSPSYRVLMVGGKIIQTALKMNNGWKATGVYAKKIGRFDIDKGLADIASKIHKHFKINICGIDLLKKNNEWLVLEVNSVPALDFFEEDREKVIDEILNFLMKQIK